MSARISLYKGGVALFVAASLVACGGGMQSITPQAAHSQGGNATKTRRHAMSWNVGSTQPLATGVAIMPLTLTLNGTVGTVGLFGTTACAAPSGANPCPNINFMASPPQYMSSLDVPMTLAATTLSTTCTPPAGAATPAPGFTAACYVVTYEGGVGPYVLQGPVTSSGSSLSVPAQASTVYFQGLTGYNVFLEYVTSLTTPPPALTPSPAPSPTEFMTPTPVPSPTPKATFAPSPCPTSTSDDDGGDDGEYRDSDVLCASPSPKPTPTCGSDDDGHHKRHSDSLRRAHHHHRHHHHGDDGGECGSDD